MLGCDVLLAIPLGRPCPTLLEVAALGAWVAPLELVQAGVEELGVDGNMWKDASDIRAYPQVT